MIRAFPLCMLLMVCTATAHDNAEATSTFAQLQEQLKVAHHDGNAVAVLSESLKLADFVHYSGPATEQVAMAYAALDEQAQTLDWLRDFTAMGQSDDELASAPPFANRKPSPAFQRVLAAMRENETPVEHASTAIKLHDAGLLPEDIDYDTSTKSFLLTSVLKGKIIRLGLDGNLKEFAQSPDGWPMLAIKIDARHGVVWATEVAMDHFAGVPPKDWGRSALLCLRLRDGALIRKIDVPHTALGDMALLPDGDAIVSDGDNGGIYRAQAGCTDASLQRVDAGQFISPQTPTPLPDGRHVYVPDYVRGVAILDLETGRVQWIDAQRRHAMQGIDGMYLVRGKLLAIQNGTSPERVVLFGLQGRSTVADERVIDRSSPMLGYPTHGVMVGDEFYYIANSGWNALNDQGRPKLGVKMTPATVRKAPIFGP